MVNIVIIFVLFIGMYVGAKRGLILQLVHTAGYILSWIVANMFHQRLAESFESIIPYPSDTIAGDLSLYNLMTSVQFDKFFYRVLAYVSIIWIGWLVTRLVAMTLTNISKLPVLNQLNGIGGAVLGFACNWIGLYFILMVLSLVPVSFVQDIFSSGSLATIIVKETPIVSQVLLNILR